MMIARLEEQKLLLNDPNYIRTSRTWVKKNGELTPIDRQQRVLPWWRVNADGSYVFFVRLGSKPIEFEKGKNAVAVPSLDKMPLVINILITAVRNGELDEQLAQTKKPASVQDGVILTRGAACGQSVQVPSGFPGGICHKAFAHCTLITDGNRRWTC
jgi:hypothetical protein